jgi:hypothetical protein
LADPNMRADAQAVFWLPETHDQTVILTASPSYLAGDVRFSPEIWPGETIVRHAPGGTFVLVRDGSIQHRLWLPGPPQVGARLAAIIPLNATTSPRAQATLRFYRHLARGRASAPSAFPRQRLRRFALTLRALDGRNTGASYRAIAEGLHGTQLVAAEAWKTSSIRDTTIRLVRSGIAMMRRGYRKLLKAASRD